MGKEYTDNFTIGYFGTDANLLLSPSSLAVYFQDFAISHSDSLGYTLDRLAELKRGWAITNWHINVLRYPKCGETITISTWSSKCRRMQAERSFSVYDDNGSVICTAVSRWIFMDLEKRKPALIEEDMEEAYACELLPAIEGERYVMPKGVSETLYSERVFTVTRRDTDTNGHTNNTKYIEWAIDDIPDDIYKDYVSTDIKVVYRKECYKGSNVLSKCYVEDLGEYKQVISFFLNADDQTVIFAEIATVWSKNFIVK